MGDWAAWLPDICQVRLLVRRLGGPLTGAGQCWRRGGSEGQSHKEEKREGGSGTGKGAQGPLAEEES